MDDEDRTWWYCSLCEFQIEEDESKECCCGNCDSPLSSVSWLVDKNEGFYWCFSCNKRTDNLKSPPDYEALLKELNKMNF